MASKKREDFMINEIYPTNLAELIVHVDGKGTLAEVSALYRLCDMHEKRITEQEALLNEYADLIHEASTLKTCDGCKYDHPSWFNEYCGHCEREKYQDHYTLKGSLC